jgi:hypothetical protein
LPRILEEIPEKGIFKYGFQAHYTEILLRDMAKIDLSKVRGVHGFICRTG